MRAPQKYLDKNKRFLIKQPGIERKSGNFIETIPAVCERSKEKYFLYVLHDEVNPSRSLISHYCFCTRSQPSEFQTSLFCEFALQRLLLNSRFLDLDEVELKQMLFYSPPSENKSSEQKTRQNSFFNKVMQWRRKWINKELQKEQIKQILNEKYKKFEVKENVRDKQILYLFIEDILYNSLEFQSMEMIEENVEELNTRLNKENIFVTEKLCPMESCRQLKHETVIGIKDPEQILINLEDLFINMDLLPEIKEEIPVQKFSTILYRKIMSFNESFGDHYMCLSPENILFSRSKQEIQLNIIPVILKVFGVYKIPQNLDALMKGSIKNPTVQFWKTKEELERKKKKLFKSGSDILWEFLMIVDYFEKSRKGFFHEATNVQQIIFLQTKLKEKIEQKEEREYFGETFARIIGFLRKKHGERFKIQNLTIQSLDQFFSKAI